MSTVPYSPAHDVRKYISLEMALSLVGVAFWLLLAMPDLSKDVTDFSDAFYGRGIANEYV